MYTIKQYLRLLTLSIFHKMWADAHIELLNIWDLTNNTVEGSNLDGIRKKLQAILEDDTVEGEIKVEIIDALIQAEKTIPNLKNLKYGMAADIMKKVKSSTWLSIKTVEDYKAIARIISFWNFKDDNVFNLSMTFAEWELGDNLNDESLNKASDNRNSSTDTKLKDLFDQNSYIHLSYQDGTFLHEVLKNEEKHEVATENITTETQSTEHIDKSYNVSKNIQDIEWYEDIQNPTKQEIQAALTEIKKSLKWSEFKDLYKSSKPSEASRKLWYTLQLAFASIFNTDEEITDLYSKDLKQKVGDIMNIKADNTYNKKMEDIIDKILEKLNKDEGESMPVAEVVDTDTEKKYAWAETQIQLTSIEQIEDNTEELFLILDAYKDISTKGHGTALAKEYWSGEKLKKVTVAVEEALVFLGYDKGELKRFQTDNDLATTGVWKNTFGKLMEKVWKKIENRKKRTAASKPVALEKSEEAPKMIGQDIYLLEVSKYKITLKNNPKAILKVLKHFEKVIGQYKKGAHFELDEKSKYLIFSALKKIGIPFNATILKQAEIDNGYSIDSYITKFKKADNSFQKIDERWVWHKTLNKLIKMLEAKIKERSNKE